MAVKLAITAAATGASTWYPMDSSDLSNGPIGLTVVASTSGATGTLEYTMQNTDKDETTGRAYSTNTPTLWAKTLTSMGTMAGTAASTFAGRIDHLVSAVRLNVSSLATSGETMKLYVSQGSLTN